MRVAISGGAGFLGLHLTRRLRAEGAEVRTLDVVPLEEQLRLPGVEALLGDVRDARAAGRLAAGADVLVHAAAALPIVTDRREIRSVNVDGTACVLLAALAAGVRRVVLVSSTAVYGVPARHPIEEGDPLAGVGAYGWSKIAAEEVAADVARRGLDVVTLRPKTFLGPERLGVFEILFDWVREGRRIPVLGDGENRYQLLAVEDLVDAVVRSLACPPVAGPLNVGAARFGTVAEDLGALLAHAGSGSTLRRVPAGPAGTVLRGLELARLSPLGEWHYRTAYRDSFVSIERARGALGWSPGLSNAETLCATYDWYLAHRSSLAGAGTTHRVPWDQRALGLLRRLS
jgi:nucleoside-diphosphate-sugar epimerase